MNNMADVSKRTEESPRFVSGTLVFYEGDVFDVAFHFDLTEDGEDVHIGEEEKIRFTFERYGRLPESMIMEIPGTEAVDDVVTLHFTPEFTGYFRRGKYTYRIQYVYASGAVTVAAYGDIVVE